MSYSNSVYFIPVWFDEYEVFTKKMLQDGRWSIIPPEELKPSYLLNYATNIIKNKDIFCSYRIKDLSHTDVYMFSEELSLAKEPEITEIRMSCFSTGVGFIEFHVSYTDMTPEQIADFAYNFKKAAKKSGKPIPGGKTALYDYAQSIMPEKSDAKLFFTKAESFKYECQCYHFIHIDGVKGDDELADKRLEWLRRSYNTEFIPSSDSEYDMVYKPYPHDQWGGSSEGLANISYDADNDKTNFFIHNYKFSHLSKDYYFAYLILLNQRFSAIQYISELSDICCSRHWKIEKLNKRIVKLKTVFTFEVISDDQIFQNLYAKMYMIFKIDCLLRDIRDNENLLEIIRDSKSAQSDKLSSILLFGISVLSLFSAMIDSASFFDRIRLPEFAATALSVMLACAIMVLCSVWYIKREKF